MGWAATLACSTSGGWPSAGPADNWPAASGGGAWAAGCAFFLVPGRGTAQAGTIGGKFSSPGFPFIAIGRAAGRLGMLAAATIGGSESAAPSVLVAEGADANAGVT